ncbi:peptide-methionine (S)-S-oxide reductase MsrA [Candidatus Gottesmanbacteria bacterium]|nr:peptide-methionine (S)-S-oxide reductase MsrA [Candidatus Gottesmanbacteria bacterium]
MQDRRLEKATLAGGCFWCIETVFRRIRGVVSVVSGYSGGSIKNPKDSDIYSGKTGHAEAIQITFDPSVISFERLLYIFWHMHNPTTLNKQGADIGTQYRSVIFYHSDEQKKAAFDSKRKIEKEGIYEDPIVTEIIPFKNFYPAPSYHQNFYEKNSYQPYCSIVIDPKIRQLVEKFAKDMKDEYR